MALNKIKLLFIAAGVTLILLLVVLVAIFGGKKTKNKIEGSPVPIGETVLENNVDILRFKRAKYTFLPLTEDEASGSGQSKPDYSYYLGLAKVSYLPLPNIFEGTIEKAISLEQFRVEKKAIAEDLKEQGVLVCDLHIYWVRPKTVEIKDLTIDDLVSDGCR